MKRTLLCALLLGAFTLNATAADPKLDTQDQKLGYAVGVQMGMSLKHEGIEPDLDALFLGIRDAMAGKEPRISQDEARKAMMAAREAADKKRGTEASKNEEAGKQFLAENAKKPGVKTTASGLQYKVIKAGTGKQPTLDDRVTTHYTGKLLDGTVFDSSRKRGAPATFPVRGVIAGWIEALQLMHEGDHWEIYVPANLAYGERGAGTTIGPNSTLIFDIELLKVESSN
ncbi:FKBP-type peptidyl-prolyl cis-trans isomerase [Nitrogeniibacter mangrovi]|uniref:Peptidyl-prolyl cis-trans isomerase n=1 Tax=Nitrogeniibacter mangrovi TaxID=2016596 RepID=A0A6C1B300_9RHOO|nr:FKBP-type peptidyl-prolyl cis-trans isomerase [Nitrogeniibacter mangrovi]QID16594.1 FKBP-type peptidyl-prolyl cis-trans isomerase [Nitrogeniibacter mangrovi]